MPRTRSHSNAAVGCDTSSKLQKRCLDVASANQRPRKPEDRKRGVLTRGAPLVEGGHLGRTRRANSGASFQCLLRKHVISLVHLPLSCMPWLFTRHTPYTLTFPWEQPLTGRRHAVPEAQAPTFVPVGHGSWVQWPLLDPWSMSTRPAHHGTYSLAEKSNGEAELLRLLTYVTVKSTSRRATRPTYIPTFSQRVFLRVCVRNFPHGVLFCSSDTRPLPQLSRSSSALHLPIYAWPARFHSCTPAGGPSGGSGRSAPGSSTTRTLSPSSPPSPYASAPSLAGRTVTAWLLGRVLCATRTYYPLVKAAVKSATGE